MRALDIKADVWVCDNDGTLYSCMVSLEVAVIQKMVEFISRERNMPLADAAILRKDLLRQYQVRSNVVALHREGLSDIEKFIEETYLAVPLCDFGLTRSEPLFELMAREQGEKLVLTNAPSKFARSVLKFLGGGDLFNRIVGIQETGFWEKPNPSAFSIVQPYLAVGKTVVLIDDGIDNVLAAEKLGCVGILWDKERQEALRI